MDGVRFIALESRDALALRLAEEAGRAIADALAARGRASVALSGGGTPGPAYRALAARPLDWTRVDLALVDERWVAPTDGASNERLMRECFAPALARGARFAPMKTDAAHAADALAAAEPVYRALRPFDLAALGMGEDGHTASWFPRAEGLAEALDPPDGATLAAVRAVGSPVAGPHVERMTLTRPAVVEARRRVLAIVGAAKRTAFERAREPGPEADAPVRALWRAADSALDVLWAA